MEYSKSITLDVYNDRGKRVTVFAKQGDTARVLKITLTASGVKLTPESGAVAALRVKKGDGHSVDYPVTIEKDGTITAPLSAQAVAWPGRCQADVYLAKGSAVLSNAVFDLYVEAAPVGDGLASSDELGTMLEATAKAREATEAANEATVAANKAESERAAAETARANAEKQRGTAEAARVTAETARESAEQKRATDTAKAIKDAQTATGAANTAASAATAAAGTADKAATRANTAAEAVEGGMETLIITDDDDRKKWATKMYIRSGHLVLVSDEKTT